MALAFLPALVLAMAIAVAVGPERGRRAVNAVLATVVGLAVALPWYWVNWSRVYEYLTSFGYGSRAREYGTSEPFFSRAAWRLTSQYVVHSVYLPFVLLMVVGAVTLVVVSLGRARRQGPRPVAVAVLRSPLDAVGAARHRGADRAPLVAEQGLRVRRAPHPGHGGLRGVGVRPAPRPAPAAADGGDGGRRRRERGWCRPISARGWRGPGTSTCPSWACCPSPAAGGRCRATRPTPGPVVLTATQPVSRKQGVAWVAASADVAARLRAHDGPIVVTAFGFRHRLVNVNSVQFEELSAGEPPLPLDQVAPLVTTDTVDGYAAWLSEGGAAAGVCNLLTATGNYYEIAPPVTPAFMEEAARRAGFVVRRSGRCPTSGWCRCGGGRPSAPAPERPAGRCQRWVTHRSRSCWSSTVRWRRRWRRSLRVAGSRRT